jgi:hypothetical protein
VQKLGIHGDFPPLFHIFIVWCFGGGNVLTEEVEGKRGSTDLKEEKSSWF